MMRPEPRSIMCSSAGLDMQLSAREIDAQDLVPVVDRHAQNRRVHGDAGVVDEDVEPAVLLDHLADRRVGSPPDRRRCPGERSPRRRRSGSCRGAPRRARDPTSTQRRPPRCDARVGARWRHRCVGQTRRGASSLWTTPTTDRVTREGAPRRARSPPARRPRPRRRWTFLQCRWFSRQPRLRPAVRSVPTASRPPTRCRPGDYPGRLMPRSPAAPEDCRVQETGSATAAQRPATPAERRTE
jgi:hypothetical protein